MARIDNWFGVYLPWQSMLTNDSRDYEKIITWLDEASGGLYHITNAGTAGYTFNFERTEDAMMFRLRWE